MNKFPQDTTAGDMPAQQRGQAAPQGASARGPSKPAPPSGALGVARGCLEVSSAEVLLLRWHLDAEQMDAHARSWESTSEPTIAALCRGTADGIRKSLQELRREMGLPYPRQPQDNGGDEPRAGSAATPKQ